MKEYKIIKSQSNTQKQIWPELMAPTLAMACWQRWTPPVLQFSTIFHEDFLHITYSKKRTFNRRCQIMWKQRKRWRLENPLHYSFGKYLVVPTSQLRKKMNNPRVYTANKNEIVYIWISQQRTVNWYTEPFTTDGAQIVNHATPVIIF